MLKKNNTCSFEISIGSLNKTHVTDSLKGGVVSEPGYVQ